MNTVGDMNHKSSMRFVRNHTARALAEWLSLAGAPTFAVMALLSVVLSDGRSALICSTAQASSWLLGMVPMYLLMSAFHLAPWLRLIASRLSHTRKLDGNEAETHTQETIACLRTQCTGPVD
jgi:hypothetical protein